MICQEIIYTISSLRFSAYSLRNSVSQLRRGTQRIRGVTAEYKYSGFD